MLLKLEAQVQMKAPNPYKVTFFEKKSLQLTCAYKIFKVMCGIFLKTNGSRGIFNL